MPYKTNEELPKEIRNLPYKAQSLFRTTFNKVYPQRGETIAFKIAWEVVKKRFKKVDGKWVAKGMGFNLYSFKLENTGEAFIKKGDDGEHYLEAVLSDNMLDSDGKAFTPEVLQDYAEQINKYGISGFITHSDWNKFCMEHSHLPESVFIEKARQRKGILKTVKAIYDKGKLWIKALIDKRYLKRVKEFNKLSIEAFVPKNHQIGNKYVGGYVLGFALDNNAINPRAKIESIE
jgi:cation transport regulator ChaB